MKKQLLLGALLSAIGLSLKAAKKERTIFLKHCGSDSVNIVFYPSEGEELIRNLRPGQEERAPIVYDRIRLFNPGDFKGGNDVQLAKGERNFVITRDGDKWVVQPGERCPGKS